MDRVHVALSKAGQVIGGIMLAAFLTGLGMGIGFFVVFIPCVMFIVRDPARKSFNDELIKYWEKQTDLHEQQVLVLTQMAESMRDI